MPRADRARRLRRFAEAVFGPVVAVVPFDDEDDAIRLANDTPYRLSGSIWTENRQERLHRHRQEQRMSRLQDRVVVVTGGGRGIGLASARRLAAEGACVVVGDADEAAGAAAAKEVDGPFVPVDVTIEDLVAALFAARAGCWP